MEKKGKKANITIVILQIVAVLSVIVAVTAFIYSSQTETVPDFSGKTLFEAERYAYNHQLIIVNGQKVKGDKVLKGQILSQVPLAGEKVKPGTMITVNICGGSGDGRTPDVTGMKIDEARAVIEEEGFLIGNIVKVADVAEKGVVLEQDPSGDKERELGIKINLKVSDGSMVVVPNIVGMYYRDAYAKVKNIGLRTDEVEDYEWKCSDRVKCDYVISQSIRAGTKVKRGTYITFVVSLGPEDDEEYDEYDEENEEEYDEEDNNEYYEEDYEEY